MRALARLVAASLVAVVTLVPQAGASSSAEPSPGTLLARHVPILVLHLPRDRERMGLRRWRPGPGTGAWRLDLDALDA